MAHNVSYAYPSVDHLKEALPIIGSKLQAQEVELPCLVHASYTVLGFGLSQIMPHNNVKLESIPPGLTELAKFATGKVPAAGGLFPWIDIVDFVTRMVLEWLKNRK